MKILYLITSWDFGGAEHQVMELAESLNDRHEILIVTMIDPEDDFMKLSDSKNLRVMSLKMTQGKPSLSSLWRYVKLNRSFRPDVTHAHMVHANFLARSGKLCGAIGKVVCTAHSVTEGGRAIEFIYSITDFLSDHNTNVSKAGTQIYLQKRLFSKNKTHFVPNGIQAPKQLSHYHTVSERRKQLCKNFKLNPKCFIWLSVGRLEPPKDYKNLIQALKKVKSNSVVLIAGKGSLENQLRCFVNEHELENRVIFLGLRQDIPELLASCDAFVMSSAWEGLPIAILEACNIGLPAVVTNVGGCGEVVINNQNGIVIEPENATQLAAAIDSMENLPYCQRRIYGEHSLHIIKQQYSMSLVTNTWESLYAY